MPSRAARQTAPTRRRRSQNEIDATVRPRRSRSRTLLTWLAVSFALPLLMLLALKLAGVQLGQGYFATLWSPLTETRLMRLLAPMPVAAAAVGGVWALANPRGAYRVTGAALAAAAMLGAGVWVWWAPPEPMNQQAFNMSSLSTDGAFVFEAKQVDTSLPEYLRRFPTHTLRRSVDDIGGTRVLSNPPGMTALAYGARKTWGRDTDSPGWIERMLVDELDVEPLHSVDLANQLRMSVVLTAVWVLGGFAAYGLGRVFLSPAGAVVFAALVTFNPCTVHFVPGKDPGQLLTINLMLWAWFAAWRRRSMPLAALGGAILTIGATSGLVHIWVALIASAATLWQAWRDGKGAMRRVLLNAAAAATGGLAICAIAYLTIGWNIPVTLLGVQRRWTELQSTFNMSRPIWYAIGLPIFLLFVAPGVWTLLGLNLRRIRWGFGTRLAIVTLAVMALIYGPLGVTYELPRLWVAFLPPLVLGLAIDLPLLRARGTSSRAAVALALIVGAHVAFTALHWTMFDARESENRLMTGRFYF
jgi:hypothetical protein